MKLIKGLLAIAIFSVIAVSCNDAKKGEESNKKEAVETVKKSTDNTVVTGKASDSEMEMASSTMAKCEGNCAKDGKSCDGSCKKEMTHNCAKDAACMKSGACDGSCKEAKMHTCPKDAACMKSGKCDGSCKA